MDASDLQYSRGLLIGLLTTPASLPGESDSWDAGRLVNVARHEGVVGLLHARLAEPAMVDLVPAAVREAVARAAQPEVARSLYLESHGRRLLARLAAAQLPVLLLKGSALAYWAYGAPWQRNCGDIDLLLRSRAEVDRAAVILADMGYRPSTGALPGDLVSFELTLEYAAEGASRLEVDLHWRLSSTPMFAFRFDWDELEAGAIALPTLADGARGLMPVHAWLHACMHRLQNRANGVPDTLKWIYDLDLLGRLFASDDWDVLAGMACERGLAGASLDGAAAAAARFGAVMPDATRVRLMRAAASEPMDIDRLDQWWYVQRMSLAAYPTLGLKLDWLRQRLMPERAHLRARYGADTGLFCALLRRLRSALRR